LYKETPPFTPLKTMIGEAQSDEESEERTGEFNVPASQED
jgi:hypothetical protein